MSKRRASPWKITLKLRVPSKAPVSPDNWQEFTFVADGPAAMRGLLRDAIDEINNIERQILAAQECPERG